MKKGGWLEEEIEKAAGVYQREGILHLEKVDPPVRLVGFGAGKKTIFLRNPFLDFTGTWTERGGRALHIEAKSTEKPKLEIGSGGITDRQVQALERWHNAGAATGTLWGYGGVVRWVPVQALLAQLRSETKHLKWENATPIPRGSGWVPWDWLQILRQYHP